MGYAITLRDSKFTILKENKEKALNLLQDYFRATKNVDWISPDKILSSETISEALEECQYYVVENDNGNIVEIEDFAGQKLGYDEKLFNAIAPVVENGSYIEMYGEDGDLWRWVFQDNACKEVKATITYE